MMQTKLNSVQERCDYLFDIMGSTFIPPYF